MIFFVTLLQLLLLSSTDAFVSQPSKPKTSFVLNAFNPSDFAHHSFLLSDEALSPAVEAARQKFWFYFFAGSGAGGIGAANLPNFFRDRNEALAVVEIGPTKGGDELQCGSLPKVYYSTEILEADLADAVQKAPTADFISSRSENTNYLASKGYILKDDFVKEMTAKKCNPLASFVLFDAISSGKGLAVSPIVYEEKLVAYREGSSANQVVSSFGKDLNGFLAVKIGGFLGLVFCLIVDVAFVANAGIAGFLS